jgi:hypothetical protein
MAWPGLFCSVCSAGWETTEIDGNISLEDCLPVVWMMPQAQLQLQMWCRIMIQGLCMSGSGSVEHTVLYRTGRTRDAGGARGGVCVGFVQRCQPTIRPPRHLMGWVLLVCYTARLSGGKMLLVGACLVQPLLYVCMPCHAMPYTYLSMPYMPYGPAAPDALFSPNTEGHVRTYVPKVPNQGS